MKHITIVLELMIRKKNELKIKYKGNQKFNFSRWKYLLYQIAY
jgi:hypothetical protein